MKKTNVTIKDLAEILQVSISTVSKALNDSHEISDKTKKKVAEIAELYNYHPNFSAKSLKNRATKTIGVILPDLLNYFFVQVLYGIEKESRRREYKVVTCISHESHATEAENIETLMYGQVDGLLICPSEETQNLKKYDHIKKVIDSGIPIVTFDRSISSIECSRVVSNDFETGRSTTDYLVSMGCTSIGLFTTQKGVSVMKERINGHIKSLEQHNLYNKDLIFNFDNPLNAEMAIKEVLANNQLDAIITIDELLSIKTVKVASQLNIKIPEELKVVGFSNGELSREFYPSVSSIDQRAEEMGAVAANILIAQLKSDTPIEIENRIIESSLVIRDSSKES